MSFLNEDEDHRLSGDEVHIQFGVRTEQLTSALAEVGNNWERQPLRVEEGRAGWEEALIGCVKDVSWHIEMKCLFFFTSGYILRVT